MGWKVMVNTGVAHLDLPDGNWYIAGDTVILTDPVYNSLTTYQLSQITVLSQIDVGTTGNLLICDGTPATQIGSIGDYCWDSTTGNVWGPKSIEGNWGLLPTLKPLNQSGVQILTDAPTIQVDASINSYFRVTLGGNRTLGIPTNLSDGARLMFEIIQDSTGNRTLTWSSTYKFSTTVPQPTLSTTPGQTDYVVFIYNLASNQLRCLAYNGGF